ncbi:disks large homolog 1 [Leucoraja erinacea]|uniref:disks large homolog 1 n=1 Tax=Leucoraja erinaceus TaxID=7782 RepID=UPI002455093A|nr:disks large homolog 1 [Leucoraja erinacea]
MENHYEEESASKYSGNVFETVGIHRSSQRRGSVHQNHRPCKLICTLNNSGQDVRSSPNNANAETRPPNGSQATLYISTGFKGTWKKVSITVCSQMGSLGISIAGGKGSTPYKINPEGIIISKVSRGGPADLAGLRVGDIMLEVNGISLQNVTHCEAVNALRNSGTVIKILILRFMAVRPDTTATSSLKSSDDPPDCTELYQKEESQPEGVFLEKMTCNGNNLRSAPSGNHPINFSSGTPQKRTSFRIMNHTMPLPQIILTHPSTSDEELEQLTFEKDECCTEQSENPDGNDFSDYLNSAFYPP